MDLSTTYLGIKLKNPLVPSASPLMESIDNIKHLEDAGASAVVLHSLFEEQISDEALSLHYHTTQGSESFAEALSYFPEPSDYTFGGDEYIEHLRKAKKAVDIPVIGSLNGVTTGGWLKYANHMQDAGADAIELNLYNLSTDPAVSGSQLEDAYVKVAEAVRNEVTIPVAIKLSPFFTSLPAIARRFHDTGINGLVLFNRFYQPDFDIDKVKVYSHLQLSNSSDIRLPLRWIGILYGKVDMSLAATTGVHKAEDVIKLLMAGADVTMLASALLKNGVDYLKQVLFDLEEWLIRKEYESIEQLKGSMSQKAVEEPAAYERALYLKELMSYY